MTGAVPGWWEDGSAPAWVRWAYSARDGLVHAFPLDDSQRDRWPLAVCTHTAPPAAVTAGVCAARCAQCVLRVTVPGTGRWHRRIDPAALGVRMLARFGRTTPLGTVVPGARRRSPR